MSSNTPPPPGFGQKCRRLFAGLLGATLRPLPVQVIWQWLDENVVVPLIVGSRFPGQLDTGVMPQWRGLLEKYADRRVHFFTLCKSARVGGTLFFGICLVLEKVVRSPGPILWIDPTRKTALRVSRQEIEPYLKACAEVFDLAILSKTTWTALEKIFKTCTFSVIGAGSMNDFGGRQGELIVINELDRVPSLSSDTPSPSEEAKARSSQFEDTRKIVKNSTPTRENMPTWQEFLAGSQLHCYVPCPACERKQRLTMWREEANPEGWMRVDAEPTGPDRELFSEIVPAEDDRGWLVKGIPATGQIWWPPDLKDPKTKRWDVDLVLRQTRYECAFCGEKIRPEHLARMNDGYEWRSHNPRAPRDHVSAHISALYSPFQSWGAIAKEYLLSIGSVMKLFGFYNLILGLPFVSMPTKLTKKCIELLQQSSPRFERQNPQERDRMLLLPVRPCLISLAVDVQQTGFWWSVRAWAVDGSRYLLAWGECVSFAELEDLANRKWTFDHGPNVPPAARLEEFNSAVNLIDTGYKAKRQAGVYRFIYEQNGRWQGTKGGGYQGRDKPIYETSIQFNFEGKAVDIPLVHFNDFQMSENLSRFVIKERRPPGYYLPIDVDEVLIQHLTSPHLVKRKMADGRTEDVWEYECDPHLYDTEKQNELVAHLLSIEMLEAIRAAQDQERGSLLERITNGKN